MDVLSIQEHRILHSKDIRYQQSCGQSSTFIHASYTQNSTEAAVGGVGILLSKRAMKYLVSVEKISSRIMVVTLSGNPTTTIVVVYSPTNVSDLKEGEDFYRELGDVFTYVPAHNFLAVLGDRNASRQKSRS